MSKSSHPCNVAFTRKSTGERTVMTMDSALISNAYLFPVWLPRDLAAVPVAGRIYLLNLRTMEIYRTVDGTSPAVVIEPE